MQSLIYAGNRVVDSPVELIGDKILAASASSVSFVVPSGYDELILFWHDIHGSDTAAQVAEVTFNSDTAGNYDMSIEGFGTASDTKNAENSIAPFGFADSDGIDYFSAGYMVIFNRAGQEKVCTSFNDQFREDNEDVTGLHSEGKWRNTTDEIALVTVTSPSGNFDANGRFTLLGIKSKDGR